MDDAQRDGKASGTTTPMPYWDRVASRYATEDPLAAVCYPAAPRSMSFGFKVVLALAVLIYLIGILAIRRIPEPAA